MKTIGFYIYDDSEENFREEVANIYLFICYFVKFFYIASKNIRLKRICPMHDFIDYVSNCPASSISGIITKFIIN